MAQQKTPRDSDSTVEMTQVIENFSVLDGDSTRVLEAADNAEDATVPFAAADKLQPAVSTDDLDATVPFEPAKDTQAAALPKVTKLENLDAYGDGNWENAQIAMPAPTYDMPSPSIYPAEPRTTPVTRYRETLPGHLPAQFDEPAAAIRKASHNRAHPAAYHQELTAVYGASPAREKPILSKTRRFLCILLVPVFLVFGAASSLAYWVQTSIVDPEGFKQLSSSLAHNKEFQSALAGAATDDFMNSTSATALLGDGNSTAWYGGAQNWLHDQVNTAVHDSAQTLVNTDTYPKVWEAVMSDTHAYLFNGEIKPAALDLNHLYDQLDAYIGQPLGLDLNADADQRLVLLDGANGSYPLNTFAQNLTNFGNSWQTLTGITAVTGLLMFVLWPANRFLFASVVGCIATAALLLGSVLAGSSAFGADALNIPTSTGKTFVQQLISTLSGSLASYNNSLAITVAIISAVLLALAITCAVVSRSVRAITDRSRHA